MSLKRCFLLGSGYSLKEGVDKDLFAFLKNEVTFGINETIKFFEPTVAIYGDWQCYASRYEYFSKHPLVIGRNPPGNIYNNPQFDFPKQKNLILLQSSSEYHLKDKLVKGLYTPILTGAFALSLAIELGYTNIFLLGFDNRAIEGKTHWYEGVEGAGEFQDLDNNKLSGVGFNDEGKYKTSFYDKSLEGINEMWKPFLQEKDISIINVSPSSKITVFDTCDYPRLFTYLNRSFVLFTKNKVREDIRNIVLPFNKYKAK